MISEQERHPLMNDDGQRLLTALLEHDAAPRYNHICGDRIDSKKLAKVRAFEDDVRNTPPFDVGQPPSWAMDFAHYCVDQVPRYRNVGRVPRRFQDIPTSQRDDLVAGAHYLVPDDHPLDDFALYATTGTTTGEPALIPSTPIAAASYGALLRHAMSLHGIDLCGGPGVAAVAQICWQHSTYTFAAISSFFDQAALLKLNLNPDDWKMPSDPARFLDEIEAEVYTGDPIAFAKLAHLKTAHRPKALLSTAAALSSDLRTLLSRRFECPVIDIYGMNEAGPIAASLPDGAGHRLLQPRLYVEILDDRSEPCTPGERGEITLTGGFNTALPLLRYRTGDHAALQTRDGYPVLVGLAGRPPVALESSIDTAVNTIDARAALAAIGLTNYRFHQRRDLSIHVECPPVAADQTTITQALRPLFGRVPIHVGPLTTHVPGPSYTSDFPA